ncbi:hypothetical protein Ancab_021747 [Ancistrocladus abbreviatus]
MVQPLVVNGVNSICTNTAPNCPWSCAIPFTRTIHSSFNSSTRDLNRGSYTCANSVITTSPSGGSYTSAIERVAPMDAADCKFTSTVLC